MVTVDLEWAHDIGLSERPDDSRGRGPRRAAGLLPPAEPLEMVAPRGPGRTRARRRELLTAIHAPRVRPPTEEQVRLRAYFKYVERRGGTGDELGDWLRAEAELWGEYRRLCAMQEPVRAPARRHEPSSQRGERRPA